MSGPGTEACVESTWHRTEDGYGRRWVDGVHVRSNRYAWEQANGPIPVGKHVLHSCDNPPCINVAHLRLGTNDDNIRDRVFKGRSVHKLAPVTVAQIKRLLAARVSRRELARRHGVSPRAIGAIANGTSWRDV